MTHFCMQILLISKSCLTCDFQVEKEKVLHCTFVVVKNQLLSFCLMAVLYPLMCYRGMPWGSELPTFQQVLLQLIGCIILEEFGFYYTHR